MYHVCAEIVDITGLKILHFVVFHTPVCYIWLFLSARQELPAVSKPVKTKSRTRLDWIGKIIIPKLLSKALSYDGQSRYQKRTHLLSQIFFWHFFHNLRWITAEGVVPVLNSNKNKQLEYEKPKSYLYCVPNTALASKLWLYWQRKILDEFGSKH